MDPTIDEMRTYLDKFGACPFNEFDREAAIFWFADRYHSGQSSNLYAALSASDYKPGRSEYGPEEGSEAQRAYWALESAYLPKSMQWAIAYETISADEAYDGESVGAETISGLTFGEAIQHFRASPSEQGIEADSYPICSNSPPRWFTAYSSMDQGYYLNTSLHIPAHITASSRLRIARLLRVYKA